MYEARDCCVANQKKKRIIISNKLGLHTRAAAKLVELTSKYCSKVEIIYEEKVINGKSIMAIMMLAASQGTELEFRAHGDDEDELMKSLEYLIKSKFGENE